MASAPLRTAASPSSGRVMRQILILVLIRPIKIQDCPVLRYADTLSRPILFRVVHAHHEVARLLPLWFDPAAPGSRGPRILLFPFTDGDQHPGKISHHMMQKGIGMDLKDDHLRPPTDI